MSESKFNENQLDKSNSINNSLSNQSNQPTPKPHVPYVVQFRKTPKFYRPENLDLPVRLKAAGQEKWIRHVWKLHYVLTLVYRARWNKAFKKRSFVPLNSTVLHQVLGSRFYAPALRLLIQLEILETNNHYKVNGWSKGFRFKAPYQSAKFKEVKDIDLAKLPARLLKEKEPPKDVQIEHQFLRDNLQRVTFDSSIAEFFAQFKPESGYQADYYTRSVEFVQNGEWFFNHDTKTGRVFNNITSLPKELRPFLRLNGKPLVEVDIANCQPLLLLSLYGDEPEREQYSQAVQSGNFYELLDEQLENPYGAERRKELKQAVFTQIFFDRIRPNPSKLCQAFANLFPVLFGKIQELKRPNYVRLALLLQGQCVVVGKRLIL